jgi:hypothetical protein
VICCMLPLPALLHISLPISWYITLPLGTWMIYLADHLLDVKRKKQEYPSPRHQFIKRNQRPIIAVIVCISVVIAWQVLHPFSVLLFTVGFILTIIVALHLFIVRINPTQQLWFNNKELAIALIYATGIYAAPIVLLYQHDTSILLPMCCALLLAINAFVNLLMASMIELKWDEEMDNTSLVRLIGIKSSVVLFYCLLLLSVLGVLCLSLLGSTPYMPMLISYLAITLGHLFIYIKKESLIDYLAYRKLSEALFWLPAIAYCFLQHNQ